MPHDRNLYLLLLSKELVVRHLACQECICLQAQGLIQEKRPCATAKCNRLDGTLQEFIVLQTLNMKQILHSLQESQRVFRTRQITYHATPCRDIPLTYPNLMGLHHAHIHQP